VVTTAEALLAVAHAVLPETGDFLIVDCLTPTTALARGIAIVPRTTVPVHIVHARQDFVDDLRAVAHGEVVWLPPELTGLSLLDKLRLLHLTQCAMVTRETVPVEATAAFSCLTDREHEVLECVAAKLRYDEIATKMYISKSTLKTHVAHIRRKWGISPQEDLDHAYRRLRQG
jgi:DNA-binding NarL/FixJ family response regulator